MTMKTFKLALLAAAIAAPGPAIARDDLGNCTDPLMPYIDGAGINKPNRHLFALVDQTVQFDDKLKKEFLKKVLAYVTRGDQVTAVSFSAFVNTHYTEVVFNGTLDRPLPDAALKDVPIKEAKTFNRCLTAQWTKGRKLMAQRLAGAITSTDNDYDFSNTELIGTLNTLAKDLIGKAETTERTLLIFSDMLENSRTTTFFSKGQIRQLDPDAELAKVRKAGMIPDLSGVRIYVIGAGWLQDGSLYQDAGRLGALRTFWEKFFAAAGATLEGFGEPMLLADMK